MSTPYDTVYERLLSKIKRDEIWDAMQDDDVYDDLLDIMQDAIPRFKYPRESLTARDDDTEEFTNTLNDDTINVLADFMFAIWAKRKVADTMTISQQYHSNDVLFYSQSNHLKATDEYAKRMMYDAKMSEADYYKVSDGSCLLSTGLVGST